MIKKSIIFTLIVLDSYSIHASVNVDEQNEKITNNINDSLNVGQKNDASVLFDSVSVNIKDYFSIATCGGNSSQCTNKSLKAEANINNSATVGASVTIIGDAAKGDLNINDSSKLYTQQLWVSGNDNDINNNATNDDSNGKLLINNNSKVYVVSSQDQSPFNNDNIRWNNTIVNSNNNINGSNKAVAGDLVLGKTGNGIIEVKDSSELDVSHDLIVSTGVDGAPNTKASTIDIDSKSNVTVNGDMLGGVSASGKLSLTMKTASNMNVMGNVSVGTGNKSDISVAMSDKSVMHVGNNFDIATGASSRAMVTIDNSELSVAGSSSIGGGDGSRTSASLINGATISGSGDIKIAEGNNTHVEMTINNSSLTTKGALSIGSGNNSEVNMTGEGALVTSRGQLLVAKGDGAHATLDYTSSELTTGSAVIASGNNATAELKLKQSSFSSSGAMDIGQGTKTTTALTLSGKSQVNAQGAMSVAKGEETKANVDMSGGSALSAGSLSIGEGKASESILHGTDVTLTAQKEFVVAKGDGARATLDYTSSELTTGSAVIASGNNATADVKLEQSSFTSNGDMTIGQGTGSSATMESNNTLISAQGSYFAAQGNNATASLKYNNTDITVGGAVLGAGKGAKATLDFNNSRLVSSGGVVIGDGQNAVAELSLSDGSVFKGERINIGNGASSQNTITVTGGSVFDFGGSQNSAIGEGESSHSVVTVNNGYLYGDGSLTLAKGKNSSAELNLQDNAVSNANNISLATESGSRAIVNISNANSRQFNPVSMGAGDGYAEVNFDGVNGYTLSTNFICMDSGSCADTVINVNRGTVSLSGTNDWKGQINVYDGTRLDARGNDAVDGILNVSREAQVHFNGYSQHMTGIDNKGMIYLSDGSASSDVFLDKDYVAHDGSGVQFGIFGHKESDVMHVNGDTSGSSGIVVTTNSKNKIKKGGDILLVEVNGDSSGSFYLNSLIKNGKEYKVTGDYIDVGAWEYALNKKRKNWYLSVDMRPEPGAFINNSKSMLDMFALQRYDIPGQHRYPTLFENLYNNGMWIQFNNNSGSNSEVYDNLKTSYSLNTMMIGGDIYNWTDGYNYSQIGVMGGIGSAANKTTSTNNKKANGNVDGYTLGLYHVFQQNISDGLNDSERQGLWTYSSIQYMDYSNSVSSTNNFKADYGVNGFRLTGEVGYLKNIGGIQPSNFYVEPKLYLSHTELSGGVVEDLQGGKITYPNTLTHIEPGVFFSYRKTHESTSNDEAMFKDYIKQSVVDAWFGGGYSFKTGNYSRTNFDSDMVEYKISDSFILKSGVEFEFLKDARLLLSSSYSINNDRNLSFILGGNYYF
ncbi:TPA: autotransporter outer membrane beta-barrel domain-containing protein [Escherichia coli]|nr:autotransporter outer membrane beta-barrel domain-containing protein [Escherichia coli]HBD5459068.1 autotransporter outer membrane beta-barrel domain-containing protein [Escherichia coli]HBE4802385.1 autotransporter outer membrane beta-barrel domain-containing protein [Escherichia coli]